MPRAWPAYSKPFIAAVIEHAAHHCLEVARQRGTLALERVQPTAPADPAPQICRRRGRITTLAGPDD
ncbi:hypothetical protein GW15_0222290 [Xanthomonas axonopodis pv. vasculorum]|uniref:Uncharacterized protein n=1 Tax=Xanthomonas axonopodis pv. vasculorum TaxID=325777 RepID=A0A098PX21_9XANT|nr:hypothetical protein GW15_0222290 [Xanthomonas axonopodis pv. vasculorum]PPV04632.1 hypothetical protein XavaCFBP5823_21590 [Xanthomonas axonopodis pv. vasculorum]